MKPAAARTYVRQLCSLGLGGPAIIPELLQAVADVIPSGPNMFLGVKSDSEPLYAILENQPPDLRELFAQEIHSAFRRVMDAYRNRRWLTPSTSVLCANAQVAYGDICRSDFCHQAGCPLNRHHFLDGLVREWNHPIGTIHLSRAKSDRPFNQLDAVELARLLPHIAHGMTARPPRDETFVDSGRHGHAIVDGSGRLTHQSETARKLLCLAGDVPLEPVCSSGSRSFTALFQKLAGDVFAIVRGREAPPPVACRQNRWGRFVFRAYRLDDTGGALSGFVLVTIEYQKPLRLRLMRGLRTLPLSTKEREVCFWLALGLSLTQIAPRLNIKPGTTKKYVDSAYLKLNVHNRNELARKILSGVEHSWVWETYDFVPFLK